MVEAHFTFAIPNRLDAVTPACQKIEAFLVGHDAHPRVVYRAQLICEELVTNIIRHGYRDDQPHEIKLSMVMDKGDLRMTIEDDGRAFDPRNHEASTPQSLADAVPGGHGLKLVRRMSDGFSMKRENRRNICQVHITAPREATG